MDDILFDYAVEKELSYQHLTFQNLVASTYAAVLSKTDPLFDTCNNNKKDWKRDKRSRFLAFSENGRSVLLGTVTLGDHENLIRLMRSTVMSTICSALCVCVLV